MELRHPLRTAWPFSTGRCLQVLTLLVMLSLPMLAQIGGKVSGIVKDAQSGEALIGANVTLLGTSLGAATDVEGAYFILNIAAGSYDVQVSMIGYERMIQRGVIVNSGRTTTASFSLRATTIEQEAVVIQATRPDVEREKTSTSAIIRSDEVANLAGMRDVGDVLGLAADVTDGHFRGGRSNEEYYALQGLGIMNPLDASAAFRPIMSAVEEVEVITSGFGAQYGNAQSGVVNITMKEGKSDRWRARAEVRMRSAGMKHFGASIYDTKANPYLLKLSDPNFWRNGDASTGNRPIIGWTSTDFGGDSTVMFQMTQSIWKSATAGKLDQMYWNRNDYTVEATVGGPLDKGITMFLALRSEVTNPIVQTEQPNRQQQVMGNIAFDLGAGRSLKFSASHQNQFDNQLGSGTGFYQWLWDPVLGVSYRKRLNTQLGARFTEALSQESFYEVKLNALRTENRLGTSPWYDSVTDAVREMETGTAIITRTMNFMYYQNMTGKTFFYLANNLSNFTNEQTLTASLDASYTNQITKSHLLNGGIQANIYTIAVDNVGSIASKGSISVTKYRGTPYELSLYVQDKMEFEGMIANVGLRWDLWDSNNEYFADQFDPFVVKDSAGNPTLVHDMNSAQRVSTKPIGRLQPRVGVSFPVTTSTVFHLNYGSFMQRPSFQYVIGSTQKMPQLPNPPAVYSLANPRLHPQVTNSYDVGVMQGLGEGFTLDVSGYYKDIKDQIEQAVFTDDISTTSYFSYFNRDYADVRGFRISVTKRKGALTGAVNYHFSVATGKSASASNAPMLVKRDNEGQISTDMVKRIPVRDVLLNFDRTHNLIVNFAYVTGEAFGPTLFDTYPLSGLVCSANMFARSGRPYTPPNDANDVNGFRSPAEYNTNIKISKNIKNFFGTTATVYMEVFNVFNNKILNYNYMFNTANKADQNAATAAYSNYAFDNLSSGVMYWDTENTGSAYGIDHSFMLYENTPRSYWFGLVVEL